MSEMSEVVDRFLTYVAMDTQSEEDQEKYPSTDKQWKLARLLAKELTDLGASNVRIDQYGYVMAEIPSNQDREIPALGFLSHMDTSPDCSGSDIKPQIIRSYDGGVIIQNPATGECLDPAEFPELSDYIGQDLITTDGTTLLGADDKAGIAEIMTMASWLLSHPELPHGKICIAFTPDEEIGRGTDFFDIRSFGADVDLYRRRRRTGRAGIRKFQCCRGQSHHSRSQHPSRLCQRKDEKCTADGHGIPFPAPCI